MLSISVQNLYFWTFGALGGLVGRGILTYMLHMGICHSRGCGLWENLRLESAFHQRASDVVCFRTNKKTLVLCLAMDTSPYKWVFFCFTWNLCLWNIFSHFKLWFRRKFYWIIFRHGFFFCCFVLFFPKCNIIWPSE